MIGGPGMASESALLGAAQWLAALIQGPAVTTLAVLAVGGTGLMMLSGRIPVRRGLSVALGCFILFGAPAIARGISSLAYSQAATERVAVPAFEIPPPPPRLDPPASAPRVDGDPYAGASVRN
jgi:type IV secretory pathway VirB2 component (pilin)